MLLKPTVSCKEAAKQTRLKMGTKPIRKFSKRQAFYVSFAILFSTVAFIVSMACWKVHTIRLAESSGLYLEGTRDGSISAKTQKVISALDSMGIPESTKEPIAEWFRT
ncbi:hypothetical protein OAE56_00020 [Verrucomicrobiales bacterium]|nr:hypothetical protein [Verrucomicrobiales bacterium]MDC0314268.1 hypothetical protein [bacterium]